MTELPIAPRPSAPNFKEIRSTFTPAQERAFKKLTPEQKKQLRERGAMWGLIAADAAPGGTQSLLQVFMDAAKKGLLDGSQASNTALQQLIMQSPWGRQYTATQEEWMTFKYRYPEEYDKIMNGTLVKIGNKEQRTPGWVELVKTYAQSLGAEIADEEAVQIAETANMNKWNEAQTKQFLLGYVDFEKADLVNQAGQVQDALDSYSRQFGITLTPQQSGKYIQDILFGRTTQYDVADALRRDAAKQYTNFSDRILAGETVEDVVSPYKKLMTSLLEVPNVDLNDNLMLDVLSGKTPEGNPKYSSTSDFKRAIKSDPRWQQTNNARDEYFNVGQRILRDFGFLG